MEDCGDKRLKTTTEDDMEDCGDKPLKEDDMEDWGDKRLRTTTTKDGGELLSIVASEVIAKRLPDIGSCRLVSKVWRSVMSTGKFNREYRNNHPVTIEEYKLAVFDGDHDIPGFETLSLGDKLPPPLCEDLLTPLRGVSVLASLDGLLVVSVDKPSFSLMILNPFLLRARRLPPLPKPFNLSRVDPVGFYIDGDGDYKLVCLGRCWYTEPYGAFVYSHRLGSWTQRQFSNDQLINQHGETLVSWSHPTSWCKCLYFPFSSFYCGNSGIICFDVKTETFRETPFPRPQDAETCYTDLAVFDGRLHLYLSYPDEDPVQVWKVKDDDVDVVVDDKDWVKVDSFVAPLWHRVSTESAGNWVAVLDERQNTFQKMDAKNFKASYPRIFLPAFHYRRSRVIYVPCFVDPCPENPKRSQDSCD